MPALSLLLVPLAAALALGSLYGPLVNASLNPSKEIMTASNSTFQSDTFSVAGAIGSLAGDNSDPIIITGRWSLDVQGGTVADFTSNLTMVKASGDGYRTIQLSNLSSAEVTMGENGTALITGVLGVTINGTEKLDGVNATISLVRLRVLNIALNGPDYLEEPIYGTTDAKQETLAASNDLLTEGSGISANITEKFRPPQLPNPLR